MELGGKATLKGSLHIVLGAALALSTGFFVYIWDASGLQLQFLSIGMLCAFLAGVEIVIGLRVRRIANVIDSAGQRSMRRTGQAFVLIGVLLAVFGLYMLNTTMVMCPNGGCDSSTLWAIYGPYIVSFYGGEALIAAGALLVLCSKFVRIKAEAKPQRIAGNT